MTYTHDAHMKQHCEGRVYAGVKGMERGRDGYRARVLTFAKAPGKVQLWVGGERIGDIDKHLALDARAQGRRVLLVALHGGCACKRGSAVGQGRFEFQAGRVNVRVGTGLHRGRAEAWGQCLRLRAPGRARMTASDQFTVFSTVSAVAPGCFASTALTLSLVGSREPAGKQLDRKGQRCQPGVRYAVTFIGGRDKCTIYRGA